jgi:hypothetical protein
MTAEIAILNKLAVALAADSAVTIGQPPNAKIYNTVNKIFELSAHKPVGIMIYGRLDFMGIPYESLIKEYRTQLGTKSFPRVRDYRDDFRKYLAGQVKIDDEDRKLNLELVLGSVYTRLSREFQQLIWSDINSHGSFRKSKVNGLAQRLLRSKIRALRSLDFAAGFPKTKKLPATILPVVNDLIDQHCKSWIPNEGSKTLLRELAGYTLSKESLSIELRSGVVIAGFGDDDIFPSLEPMELDGILLNRLKFVDGPSIDIDRRGPEAEVLGFAQDDMVKSFVDGVDPSLRSYVDQLLEDGVKSTAKQLLSALVKNPVIEGGIYEKMEPVLDGIITDLYEKIDRRVEVKSSKPIKDMVRAMPKQELGTLASSLIEITSLKRKVSRGQETVGGEVDVAIISKAEGFVWIKRKHYFPAELNARFFNRLESCERAEA